MRKEISAFVNIDVEKRKFHHRKYLILFEVVDIDEILIFSMVSSDEGKL